ncbi:hypothetical protein LR48_Vigan05g035800 [Vigna angularis]|uniref:Uncharacterized protein n=1 Tax=Phaseolus angularis TaxID=3914 RepID=A0A0L9UJK7_PHAAN|nr:hypothetical protein LR48_Vigan05g035800 [Vigna angularis]
MVTVASVLGIEIFVEGLPALCFEREKVVAAAADSRGDWRHRWLKVVERQAWMWMLECLTFGRRSNEGGTALTPAKPPTDIALIGSHKVENVNVSYDQFIIYK